MLAATLAMASPGRAQVNVLTAHNDIARTGQNLSETILTPASVGGGSFGKLFAQPVNGTIRSQPLYVSRVTIPGKGVHNVVYVGASSGVFYAFDGDLNGGVDATPLWQTSLLANAPGSIANDYTILGTPVIDLPSGTLYVVSTESVNHVPTSYLHALDITTGAEKLNGPVLIQGSVAGTGAGSSNGVLTFDATLEIQRAGLLLLNGVLYVPFGSVNDEGAWHGWIFSYNAATLKPIAVWCTTPNGSGGGIWMAGAGLAAEVADPVNKPYGRMFFSTGNGSFDTSKPYANSMSFGMSVLSLDLTGGVMTVTDEFTPYNEAHLNAYDGDVGSGGVVVLPAQTLASGATLQPMVQVGKYGAIDILNRNNLGGFNAAGDTNIVQELVTPVSGQNTWGAGVWGSPAYWNNTIYVGGTNPGLANSVVAYSFAKGVLSTKPVSETSEQFFYPGPTPSISANGATNGILWLMKTDAYTTGGPAVLLAYDASNLSNLLYVSNANFARDNPGPAVKFTVPTVANGKVYIGTSGALQVYSLLGGTPTVAPPVFQPGSQTFSGSLKVTLTDATPGAAIYYTTDGSTPTASSKLYTGPITVTSSEVITALASAAGYLQNAPVAATYSSASTTASPVFSLAAGSYSGAQSLKITDASPSASIYYTVDGSTPTIASTKYSGTITVPVSETVRAIATSPGLQTSFVTSASYAIEPVYAVDFSQGFSQAQSSGLMQFNGSTGLDDFRLQLTNGGQMEAGSAFYTKPLNIQSFTTDFVFQLSNPQGDGITFTIENSGHGAAIVGGRGGSLGYENIPKSVAIKFDLANNHGEGINSTGIYTNGASPTVPAIDLTNTGINLHSGDYIAAHLTYDGTVLNMTLTDQITQASWSTSFPVNIPSIVGANTAFVGFTGGSGTSTASQKVTFWTYAAGPPSVPNYPAGFDKGGLVLNSTAALSGTALRLTDGGTGEATTAYFSTPVPVGQFTTDFDFQILNPVADGLTFVLQNAGLEAVGGGKGGLGYSGIGKSLALKLDFYNNAGEGTDSTGLYVNGAMPTVPADDMTSSGLSLTLGHVDHVHIVYDGITLTWTVEDLQLHWFATNHVAINVPQTVGSSTAYAGFTAASGDGTAVQNILDWTYTSP
jgi:hypothetical protein